MYRVVASFIIEVRPQAQSIKIHMVKIFHNPKCGTSRNTLAHGEVVINEKGERV